MVPYIYTANANESWLDIMKYLREYGEESAPRGKRIKEALGFSVCIDNPLDRIIYSPSRKMSMSYAVGEFIYYITGNNTLDFIQYYSKQFQNFTDDGKTINSAYGYRIFGYSDLFNFNQWEFIKEKIKEDPDTRQAIIHLHMPNNQKTNDELCTLTLQFMVRDKKLNLLVNMRSNDIIWGYTYDVFNFTLLQELMANELGLQVGRYYHNAASMHIYEKDWDKLDDLNYTINNDFKFNLKDITLNNYKLKYLIKEEERLRNATKLEDLLLNIDFQHETLNDMYGIFKFKAYKKLLKSQLVNEEDCSKLFLSNKYLDKNFFL